MSDLGGTLGVRDGRGGRINRACTTPFAEPQGVPPKIKLTHYHPVGWRRRNDLQRIYRFRSYAPRKGCLICA